MVEKIVVITTPSVEFEPSLYTGNESGWKEIWKKKFRVPVPDE